MARELPSGTGVDQTPSRYAEQRAPQFTGGSVDPTSGNIVPSTRDEIANRNEAAPPIPAAPTTNLASISAAPSSGSSSGLGSAIGSAAINIGSSLLGKAAGNLFSSSGDSNKGGPTGGGFDRGGGTGNGGGTPNTPFNLNPSGTATGPTGASAGLDNTMLNGGSSMAPAGSWAKDYSKAPLGTYTDTGYVTRDGLVPYASEQQKNNFASGSFAGYSRYDAPNVFTPSEPSGGSSSSLDGSASPETSAAFPAESVPSLPAPAPYDPWGGFAGGGGGGGLDPSYL